MTAVGFVLREFQLGQHHPPPDRINNLEVTLQNTADIQLSATMFNFLSHKRTTLLIDRLSAIIKSSSVLQGVRIIIRGAPNQVFTSHYFKMLLDNMPYTTWKAKLKQVVNKQPVTISTAETHNSLCTVTARALRKQNKQNPHTTQAQRCSTKLQHKTIHTSKSTQNTNMQRYHWTVLPQGMKNSPMICKTVVANIIHPVRKLHPSTIIYPYIDDILIAAKHGTELQSTLTALTDAIQKAGLQLASEKIQRTQPWTYLGWRITQQEIMPQPLTFKVTDTMTLNDLQWLLGAINWLRPVLGIKTEELHPLFELLKGDPTLTSIRSLTPEAKQALEVCSQAVKNRQSRRRHPDLHIRLAIISSKFQPFAVLFQRDQAESDPLRILEWLFLPHSPPKTVWTINDMLAKLVMKGRGCLQEMDGRDPETIYIPATKDNLDWFLAEDAGFQTALADFHGNISIHLPKHKLWAEIGNLPLMATRRCKLRPVNGVTLFTDASGQLKKAAVTWKNPATGQWDNKVQTLDQGSVQVLELAAIRMAFELFHDQPMNVVTDSHYAAGLVSRLEASFLQDVTNPHLFTEIRTIWFLINHRKFDFYIMHTKSHTELPGPIAEGNQKADATAMVTTVPKILQQAKLSHQFFHQNARSLKRQFQITINQARDIIMSCSDCQ
ncbi:PREDICTED: endogenous retrovirus group K member 11 Pol protein-like [Lepidothrix coronata]|uniref:ribonuclease H n=1 Tax=Lepidothrix coronata TaxID=321398 RepID=A0A6J0HPA9_9PASS|nr:PREDICTED: endogenous retrovirus group K member 11 Pol protein-like [Lepidothrix coronata]